MVKKHKTIWHLCDWFPVYYAFCPSEAAWKREMKRLGQADAPYPLYDACCTSFESKKGNVCCVVTVGHKKKHRPAVLAAILTHESTHVWQNIAETIGEKNPSREFEAYAIQGITQFMIDAYNTTRR